MRTAPAVALATLALALTACGSSAPAPAASPSPPHTPTTLSLIAACRILRTDIVNNGGTPDRATLRNIALHVTDTALSLDARSAMPDVGAGTDNQIRMGVDLAVLHSDCSRTGVQIPTNGGA